MKICPVCNAVAFDDAAMCYGCLHRFEEDEREGVCEEEESELLADGYMEIGLDDAVEVKAPEFLIRFMPSVDNSGAVTWKCAVEV